MTARAVPIDRLDPLVVGIHLTGQLTEAVVEAAIEERELSIDSLRAEIERLISIRRRLHTEVPSA